jgi:hypothetical protein
MNKKHRKKVYDFFDEVGQKFFVVGIVYILLVVAYVLTIGYSVVNW